MNIFLLGKKVQSIWGSSGVRPAVLLFFGLESEMTKCLGAL